MGKRLGLRGQTAPEPGIGDDAYSYGLDHTSCDSAATVLVLGGNPTSNSVQAELPEACSSTF